MGCLPSHCFCAAYHRHSLASLGGTAVMIESRVCFESSPGGIVAWVLGREVGVVGEVVESGLVGMGCGA